MPAFRTDDFSNPLIRFVLKYVIGYGFTIGGLVICVLVLRDFALSENSANFQSMSSEEKILAYLKVLTPLAISLLGGLFTRIELRIGDARKNERS